MHWQKRKDKHGKQYYSFLYWDPATRKNVRLKRSEAPAHITNDSQADEFCRLRQAENEASKFRIERKLAWQKKFYDFEELISIYEVEVKKRAPNSWEGPLYYLKQYGLDFFLNFKQCNNLNNWPLYFEEFRDWLTSVKTGKKTQLGQLAFSSRNNVIGAVNLFLDIMFKKGKCSQVPKCQKFPRHMLKRRTAEHVIADEEASLIATRLTTFENGELASDFFKVLMNTGLRLSEALSLSLSDFFTGEPENKVISGALKRHQLLCYGYISLESQLQSSTKIRSGDNVVLRKPLKGRKNIDARGGRIIPILDKQTFNIFAKRYNEQIALLESYKFGPAKENYLLFDGLNKNNFSRLLRLSYEKTKYTHKSPHCCRHTFATHFAGITNADTGLCRLVLGHRDEDTTLGYVHLFEQINRQARAKELTKSKIALID